MKKTSIILCLSFSFATSCAIAHTLTAEEQALRANGSYTQSIHVVNSLANPILKDAGMTQTSVVVKFFDGDAWPCWSTLLNYQTDDIIHAGPGLGCPNKIDHVTITPIPVANKLDTYHMPDIVRLDTTKFSTDVRITQNEAQAPVFDANSGLVNMQGFIKVQVQSDPQ